MFDTHYDLLTYILIKKNDDKFLKNLSKELYTDNILGGIINAYYTNKEEMKEEIGLTDLDPVNNFKEINEIINRNNLLPIRENYLFGIEGGDFLNIEDLDTLYSLGLRSLIPIYNHDNKYGGGAYGNNSQGLTNLGIELIIKAISLGIIIDVSHLNEKTSLDIIDLAKKLKKANPIIIASHANARSIYDIPRNLTDKVIIEIGKLDGIIGLLPLKTFLCDKTNDYEEYFIKHLKHIGDLIGYDKIGICTDDMSYHPYPEYYNNVLYTINNISGKFKNILKINNFNEKTIENILINNFKEKTLNKLK